MARRLTRASSGDGAAADTIAAVKVVVVGGGLGGLATAIALRDAGCDVRVYEGASSARIEGESISLWSSGVAALAALGVRERFGNRLDRIRTLDRGGRRVVDLDVARIAAKFGHPNVAILRSDLLSVLASHLGEGAVSFGRRCVDVTTGPTGASVSFADGETDDADIVVAADGVHSVVRNTLWPGDRETYTGSVTWEGRTAMTPGYPGAGTVLTFAASGLFAGVVPLPGGEVHWFIDERRASPQRAPGDGRRYLLDRRASYPDLLVRLVEATPDDRLGFVPIFIRKLTRRWVRGRAVLLGDAAHAMGPALSQGANRAFGDALALARCISSGADIDRALAKYQRERAAATRLSWLESTVSLKVRDMRAFEVALRVAPPSVVGAALARSMAPERSVRRALASPPAP